MSEPDDENAAPQLDVPKGEDPSVPAGQVPLAGDHEDAMPRGQWGPIADLGDD